MALLYNAGYSATNIFYFDQHRLQILRLNPHVPSSFNLPDRVPPIISSSCRGSIACRSNVNGRYHIGEPYVINLPYLRLPLPPNFHHPVDDTHVVLAIPSSSSFLLICVIQQGNDYAVHAFISRCYKWHSYHVVFPQSTYGAIVPNSGVSYGRMACWLLRPRFAFCCYIHENCWMTPRTIMLPSPYVEARMQLGRALGKLGLVFVNEANSTIELFTLKAADSRVINPWQREESFSVEISDRVEAASWKAEEMKMVCREMPRPIRFDSELNVQLLFWVQGRVVMLENTTYGTRHYRLVVFADQNLPASIVDGVPHVWSDRSIQSFDHRRTPSTSSS